WEDACLPGEALGGGHGHVLELVGHDGDAVREAVERRRVVVGPHDELPGTAGRRVRRRVEEPTADAEGIAGASQHPAELAASEDADPHGRGGATGGAGATRGSNE